MSAAVNAGERDFESMLRDQRMASSPCSNQLQAAPSPQEAPAVLDIEASGFGARQRSHRSRFLLGDGGARWMLRRLGARGLLARGSARGGAPRARLAPEGLGALLSQDEIDRWSATKQRGADELALTRHRAWADARLLRASSGLRRPLPSGGPS